MCKPRGKREECTAAKVTSLPWYQNCWKEKGYYVILTNVLILVCYVSLSVKAQKIVKS